MFKVIKKEGSARRGEFVTVHGTVQTPAFMNVATCGAIKGAVSALDLKNINVRFSFATPIICIFVRVMKRLSKWADFTNLQGGMVLSLPTAADFRCSLLQS